MAVLLTFAPPVASQGSLSGHEFAAPSRVAERAGEGLVREDEQGHPGGCARGIAWALGFQAAAALLIFLLWKVWQMSH